MSRKTQATLQSLNFTVRKSPRIVAKKVEKEATTPFAEKLEKLSLKTPTACTPSARSVSCPRPAGSLTTSSAEKKRRGQSVVKSLFGENGEKKKENKDVSPSKIRRKGKDPEKESASEVKTRRVLDWFSPYKRAKCLLSCSNLEAIVGREADCGLIESFVGEHLEAGSGSSLYISGAPGTGKSLCVDHVLRKIQKRCSFNYIDINCMAFRSPDAVYVKVAKEMGIKTPNKKESVHQIEKLIMGGKGMMTVIVLDEMDKLETKNQDVLYTLFEWPRLPNSRLILIGIANTLDLTTRTLTRIHSLKLEAVKEMHFHPYNKEEIKAIIEARLLQLDSGKERLFNPTSVELCARKVASCSGDARKALDICRRAVEVAESEPQVMGIVGRPKLGEVPLKQTSDDGLNPGSPRKRSPVKATPLKQVQVPHIMQVLDAVYGSKAANISAGSRMIPVQQQVILCAMLLFSKLKNRKEIEVGKCFDAFTKICSKRSIGYDVGNNSDFLSMCQMLESKGFLSLKAAKEARLTKISLVVDEEEIKEAMSDKTMFSCILRDLTLFN